MSDTPGIDVTNYPEILEEIAILVRGLAEEVATLKALLRELEWDRHFQCPACRHYRFDGKHAPDCCLKAAIDS